MRSAAALLVFFVLSRVRDKARGLEGDHAQDLREPPIGSRVRGRVLYHENTKEQRHEGGRSSVQWAAGDTSRADRSRIVIAVGLLLAVELEAGFASLLLRLVRLQVIRVGLTPDGRIEVAGLGISRG